KPQPPYYSAYNSPPLEASMHSLRVLAAVSLLATVSTTADTQHRADEQAIRQVVAGFVESWNRNDMHAFAGYCAPDADYVVITGRHLKGREEIEKYHAQLLNGQYKGSKLAGNPESLRFLKPDVAIGHVAFEVSYDEGKQKR